MNAKQFDDFCNRIKPELIQLIESLKPIIEDDWKESEDDEPSLQLTISCDDELLEWRYQTGDNSYTGGCYGHPYWGVVWIFRDSKSDKLAEELLNDLGNQPQFND